MPRQRCSGPWVPAMVLSLRCSTLGSYSDFLELSLLFFKGVGLGPYDLEVILCLQKCFIFRPRHSFRQASAFSVSRKV